MLGDNGAGQGTVPSGLNLIVTESQSIAFTSTPANPAFTGDTYVIAATGGASGNPVTFSSLTPVTCTVSGDSVSLIAVGSCVIAANQAGAIGYAAAPQVTQLFMITSSTPATSQVSAGSEHTCALKANGTVVCWGSNQYGSSACAGTHVSCSSERRCGAYVRAQGRWHRRVLGLQRRRPVGGAGRTFFGRSVSASFMHSCAVLTSGAVVCWGTNSDGQTTVPTGLSSVVQVSAGQLHTCALKSDGAVACWGINNVGQATVPAELASVMQLSARGSHSCALTTDGLVTCWGYNASGQTIVPAGLASVAQVAAGGAHSCALKTVHRHDRLLGKRLRSDDSAGGSDCGRQVSAGVAHTCALRLERLCAGATTFTVSQTCPLNSASHNRSPSRRRRRLLLFWPGPYVVAAVGGASGNPVTFSSRRLPSAA